MSRDPGRPFDATRTKVIEMCWEYLASNFSKFTEVNKLKIINTICGKSVPQEISGEGFSDKYTFVYMDKKATDEVKPGTNNTENRITSELPAV